MADSNKGWGWLARGFEVDLRSLALFRIALAGLVLFDLADRARDFAAMYTDAGVLNGGARVDLYGPLVQLSVHHWFTSMPAAEAAVFVLHALVAAAMLAGWRTRWTTVATWVLVCSLQRANVPILGGGDVLVRLLLFWGMFLPLGARFSLDARRDSGLRGLSNTQVGWPGGALLLQVAMMYWFTAILKTAGETWQNGSALGIAFQNRYYLTPLGAGLAPGEAMSKLMTYATLALEYVGPLLAFSPWARGPLRMAMVVVFIVFHASIELSMDVAMFSWASAVAWLAFIPSWAWDRGAKGTGAPAGAPGALERLRDIGLGVALVYVLLVNLCQLPWAWARHFTPPRPLLMIGDALWLTQRWTMFAPDPRDEYFWWILEGRLADGSRVDLWRDGAAIRHEEPALVSREFPSMRWRVYFMSLQFPEASHVGRLPLLARYAAREWNADHPAGAAVERLRITAVRRRIGQPADLTPILFYEYDATTDREIFSVRPAGP